MRDQEILAAIVWFTDPDWNDGSGHNRGEIIDGNRVNKLSFVEYKKS